MSSDYLGKCECINDLLLSAPWNDYHGNYCGAKRVNGNLSPNGQDGMSSRDIGNVKPVDELDSCCMRHDQCFGISGSDPCDTGTDGGLDVTVDTPLLNVDFEFLGHDETGEVK